MGKRIFWIFLLTVALATTAAVLYLESESFAILLKREIQLRVSKNLGVELNFDRLKIGVLPPSISLVNVDLKVTTPHNKLGLSTDTVFKAGSLGFSFRMIQAFSSGMAVNKVFLNDGVVKLLVPKSGGGSGGEKLSSLVHKPIRFQLGERFQLSIRQLEVKNSAIDVAWLEADAYSHAVVRNVRDLALTPSDEGTNLILDFEDFDLSMPKVKQALKAIKANLDIQKNLILLSALDVQRHEAAVHASGKLVGSIDHLEEARPDLNLILRSPFSELTDLAPSLGEFGGDLHADVRVVGRVRDPAVQGKLEVSGFRHGLWSIDHLEASGSYGGGAAVFDSLQAGTGGGKISLKNKLELSLPLRPEIINGQLQFENVNFQDFAGDVRKSVNNLVLKITGPVNLRAELIAGSKGKVALGSIVARPDFTIRDLELNNQTYGKNRPYKRLFKVAPFQLLGNLVWEDDELNVDGTRFVFGSGSMNVSGTFSDADGFDLTGDAPAINMETEVGEISGLPVAGKGSLKLHVYGPDNDVKIDFDISQKEAKFANFDFGEVREGHVTYNDKGDFLLIEKANCLKGTSAYSVNGRVSTGAGDGIDLAATFQDAAPDDLFAIFAHQLRHISWIPHGMTGSLSAGVKVKGAYTDGLNTLEIDAPNVIGHGLSYKGEVLNEFSAHAGVSKAVAFARNAQGSKYESRVSGDIEYNLKTDEMVYNLNANRASLRSLDFIRNSGVPLEGDFTLASAGRGRWETLKSETVIASSDAQLRALRLPEAKFTLRTDVDFSTYDLRFGKEKDFRIYGKISRNEQDNSNARLEAQNAKLEFLLCLLSRSNCSDPELKLRVTARGDFSWRGSNWTDMGGSGSLEDLRIEKRSYKLLLAPGGLPIKAVHGMMESGQGHFEGGDLQAGENRPLTFRFKGRVDGEKLDNSLDGAVSLRVLEFVTPFIEEAKGLLRFDDVRLTGSLNSGMFRGTVGIDDGTLRLSGLDAPVNGLKAELALKDSKFSVTSFSGELGGGSVTASGDFNIFLDHPPVFNVDLTMQNNRLKFYPVNYAEVNRADLSFRGDKPPYRFGGRAVIKRVMMHDNFDLGKGQKGLQNARYLPEKVAGAKAFYDVKIDAISGGGVFVDNNLLNAEFRGSLTLQNNFEFPQVTGKAELVRGKLLFRNTAFTLDHAFINLPSPEVFNPQFSIGGVANVDNYSINIFASGTIDKPKITLSSYPGLPQEDIVSLLALGYRSEETGKINPNDSSALTYSQVSSILMEQLQLNQSLQQKGLHVTVAPAVTDSEVNLIRPNNSVSNAAPTVHVQTQVMKNLDAAFGGSVGAAQGQSMDAKLEYRLGGKASVSAVYEQTPSVDATEETRSSYGADLKFRWGFK
jgi:translocation and assembly module TamB